MELLNDYIFMFCYCCWGNFEDSQICFDFVLDTLLDAIVIRVMSRIFGHGKECGAPVVLLEYILVFKEFLNVFLQSFGNYGKRVLKISAIFIVNQEDRG